MSFKRISFLAVLLFIAVAPIHAVAQERLEFIRDAEIENTIRMYATPLFAQAGVDPAAVQIHLVKDRQLNAFVAEGLNLFINIGLIMKTENAGQLIGVIAHETGHIAGGHLVKGTAAMQSASTQALITTILGAAAAVASKRGDVGAAVMAGGGDAAARQYLAFSRSIEASADTAALGFLDNLHMSARGFLDFMQTLGGQELLVTNRQDPYVRTHPLTRERVEEIRHHVENSPWSNVPVPPEYVEPHRRMRAKLFAFMDPPVTTLNRYPESDTSIEGRYARAIAYYRRPDLAHAVPLIDGLIADRPDDPYFHELKGQMLFENGRVRDAVPEYRLAVAKLPGNALLLQELGQVEVETEDPAMLPDARQHLTVATQREPDEPGAWRLLGIAYGRMGNETMAAASMAEYALLVGQWTEAIYHADKAMRGVKKGSPVDVRMQDVKTQAEIGRDRQKRQAR